MKNALQEDFRCLNSQDPLGNFRMPEASHVESQGTTGKNGFGNFTFKPIQQGARRFYSFLRPPLSSLITEARKPRTSGSHNHSLCTARQMGQASCPVSSLWQIWDVVQHTKTRFLLAPWPHHDQDRHTLCMLIQEDQTTIFIMLLKHLSTERDSAGWRGWASPRAWIRHMITAEGCNAASQTQSKGMLTNTVKKKKILL